MSNIEKKLDTGTGAKLAGKIKKAYNCSIFSDMIRGVTDVIRGYIGKSQANENAQKEEKLEYNAKKILFETEYSKEIESLTDILNQNTDRPLTSSEITAFLQKKEEFYFKVENQCRDVPVPNIIEESFKKRGLYDKNLIEIICSRYLAKIKAEGSLREKKMEELKGSLEEINDYCATLTLYELDYSLYTLSLGKFKSRLSDEIDHRFFYNLK
ncbi:hypothetical protein KY317_03920 [Candidatus Woesearchaeota archaeon]|nr:hypothetical protein [Candidatus Woesearchaeota archaeon]